MPAGLRRESAGMVVKEAFKAAVRGRRAVPVVLAPALLAWVLVHGAALVVASTTGAPMMNGRLLFAAVPGERDAPGWAVAGAPVLGGVVLAAVAMTVASRWALSALTGRETTAWGLLGDGLAHCRPALRNSSAWRRCCSPVSSSTPSQARSPGDSRCSRG